MPLYNALKSMKFFTSIRKEVQLEVNLSLFSGFRLRSTPAVSFVNCSISATAFSSETAAWLLTIISFNCWNACLTAATIRWVKKGCLQWAYLPLVASLSEKIEALIETNGHYRDHLEARRTNRTLLPSKWADEMRLELR